MGDHGVQARREHLQILRATKTAPGACLQAGVLCSVRCVKLIHSKTPVPYYSAAALVGHEGGAGVRGSSSSIKT